VLDDENFFNEEDEEDDSALVMYVMDIQIVLSLVTLCFRGNFAEALGDDFLGLRELGIESEFGLTSLSIPKKLLRGKGKGQNNLPYSA
jgi:transcriptional activator SPT7